MPVDSTYTLSPDSGEVAESFSAATAAEASAISSFFGYGLLSPFRRGPSDFVAGGDADLLASMVDEVLGTKAESDYTAGELPWRPEFGSLLHFLRHRNNDATTAELARVYVAEALARWIPQIRLKSVTTEKKTGPDGEDSILYVQIVYDIVALNRPGNEVLVSGVTQTVAVALAA